MVLDERDWVGAIKREDRWKVWYWETKLETYRFHLSGAIRQNKCIFLEIRSFDLRLKSNNMPSNKSHVITSKKVTKR